MSDTASSDIASSASSGPPSLLSGSGISAEVEGDDDDSHIDIVSVGEDNEGDDNDNDNEGDDNEGDDNEGDDNDGDDSERMHWEAATALQVHFGGPHRILLRWVFLVFLVMESH